MNVHKASLINSIILIIIGGWGYFESGSPTSLIPVGIGVFLLLLNKGVRDHNKVIAHIAVVLTLLSFANVMPLMSALDDGRNEAALRAIVMLSSSFYAMVFFIKSFIQARTK
mgnify:CR=1 FL=1|tara:strand:+ start:1650 stop:1985 length:336 start_codon:yes stop_codon:yes gene_type:complete